ncbi:hypothetical protein TDB9533_01669 [Thalassocella blandensis]|nr:hypothetical protein TDB9533_01669 [Thalassocella blandensis]
MTNDSHQAKMGISQRVMIFWAMVVIIPCCLLFVALLAAVPVGLSLLAGADFFLMLFAVVAGVTALALIGASWIGLFLGWYIAWIVSRISFYIISFIIGLGIVVLVFSLPFELINIVMIILAFGFLKLSLTCISTINSRSVRDRYSVIKYSHY